VLENALDSAFGPDERQRCVCRKPGHPWDAVADKEARKSIRREAGRICGVDTAEEARKADADVRGIFLATHNAMLWPELSSMRREWIVERRPQ